MAGNVDDNQRRPSVIWFTNIPAPYRVAFFEELGKRVDLFVVFEKDRSDERDKSWDQSRFVNFRAVIVGGIKTRADSSFDIRVLRYLRECKQYDYVMVSDPLTLLGMFVIEYLKVHRIAFSIETDGGFAKSGKGLIERIKKSRISAAQRWFSTAKIHDAYYLQYGAKASGIIRYPFSSVSESELPEKPVNGATKRELREKLGITQEKMILGVGQFIQRKGFDTLLDVAGEVGSDVAIVLLGGERTEEYNWIIEKHGLNNVYFPGFIPKEHISEYYRAADVFVLPTREDIWGLVINEAIAFALPVVTTKTCIAGTELVKPGVNGYLIAPDDPKALSDAINTILQNEKLRDKMACESLKIAQNYTIENMVRCHESVFIPE